MIIRWFERWWRRQARRQWKKELWPVGTAIIAGDWASDEWVRDTTVKHAMMKSYWTKDYSEAEIREIIEGWTV